MAAEGCGRWSSAGEGSLGEAARPDGIGQPLYLWRGVLPAGGEVAKLAHETHRPPGPVAQAGGPAQVDGLGGDQELEGDNPGGEVAHFGEALGRERGHCRAVLDPFSFARTDDLKGDR